MTRHRQRLMPLLLILTFTGLPAALACAQESKDAKDAKKPEKAIVAVFPMRGAISESSAADDLPFGSAGGESLRSLLSRLKKARSDDDVEAVVFLMEGASMSVAQIEELRRSMEHLKQAGKDVYVHADSLSMGSYMLAAGGSRISVVPTGDVWIHGLYGESPYIRGLLDLLGVKPDFLTCGDYKSAGEMFMRYEPSAAAQENIDWLLDSQFETCLDLMATGRGVSAKQAKRWIDKGMYTAERAMEAGIIDAVEHRQDFSDWLNEKYGEGMKFDRQYGKKKPMEIDLSSPFGLLKLYAELLAPKKKVDKKASIAIVYVEGPIMTGDGGGSPLPFLMGTTAMSSPIRAALDEAAADDSIKGVVLRVNSPGGSAVASEIILDATRRVKAKKPFVVSMGGVAGSGGYYVACGADTIYAERATITGSIGVVSGKLAMNDMWGRFGIRWKADQRGANAAMLAQSNVFTQRERDDMQGWMDEVYDVFKGHVVAIRGPQLKKEIDDLAGGRVYTGQQALELGLVDRIGGLEDAIADVAKQAKLDKYEVRVLPKRRSFLELLLSDLDEEQDPKKLASSPMRPGFTIPARLQEPLAHLRQLDPQRYQAVMTVFQQLQILQQEHAVMAMPVYLFR